MGLHPTGVVVNIEGINTSSNGRSCEEHKVGGSVLKLDSLVRFREVQIIVKGKEETALAVYWVTMVSIAVMLDFYQGTWLNTRKPMCYDG